MPSILMLVVALQGGAWQCSQMGDLWRCEPAVKERAAPPAPAAKSQAAGIDAPPSPGLSLDAPAVSPRASINGDAASAANTTDDTAPVAAETPSTSTPPGPEEVTAAGPAVERPAVDSAAVDRALVAGGDAAAYVVQIGAFRKKELAQKAAGQLDYAGLVIMPTERAGEAWFVLLLGAFPTVAEARDAGETYQQAYPEGSYWVRTAEDLRRALKR